MIPRKFDLARLAADPRDPTVDMMPEEKTKFFVKMYGLSEDEVRRRENEAILGQQKIMAELIKDRC